MTSTTRTTCPYCGVGCGILASVDASGVVSISGDPQHPANRGRLCSKGSALADTIATDSGRLLQPQLNGEMVTWDVALDTLAQQWLAIREESGADALAFYASGQMLTEDYYVANKLMKGFVGTANIDTNSRLCMSSAVAAQQYAFGTDGVACNYSDLESCDLLVLIGSNLAWCHPVLYQRIKAARERRPSMNIVVIDPRRTATCEIADLHLPLRPDTDISLLQGLLRYLHEQAATDRGFIAAHTSGFSADELASAPDLQTLSNITGVSDHDLQCFFDWFAATEKTVTAYSMGVNQAREGTLKAGAIINLHLATGRIGKDGCGPFSITGQPNAMGGREVGGLASTLAAHMPFTAQNRDRLNRFWGSTVVPVKPGLKALDLFEAIELGEVRSVWIMATNPLASLPEAARWKRALEACEFVVVSDCVKDSDTLAVADLRLPALGWGEKSGTVTNTERCISRQRAFLPSPGNAKADWWMVNEVGKRMGYADAFRFESPADVFREHAALSGFENGGQRDFDISDWRLDSDEDYESMEPQQWPIPENGTSSLYREKKFYTVDGKARFRPMAASQSLQLANAAPESLVLNTGRVRDHWHTLTRTGRSARLSEHQHEPTLSVHPARAVKLGLPSGGFARVSSEHAKLTLRVTLDENLPPDSVFVPMHWTHSHSAAGPINALVGAERDALSGEPAFKHAAVTVAPATPAWQGLMITRTPLPCPDSDYWVKVRGDDYWLYYLAGFKAPLSIQTIWSSLTDMEYTTVLLDSKHEQARFLRIDANERVSCLLAVSTAENFEPPLWAASLFRHEITSASDRLAFLSGVPLRGSTTISHTICSCNGVDQATINALIATGVNTTAGITAQCSAGGNCGSCLPEIQQMINEAPSSRRVAL